MQGPRSNLTLMINSRIPCQDFARETSRTESPQRRAPVLTGFCEFPNVWHHRRQQGHRRTPAVVVRGPDPDLVLRRGKQSVQPEIGLTVREVCDQGPAGDRKNFREELLQHRKRRETDLESRNYSSQILPGDLKRFLKLSVGSFLSSARARAL